MYKSPADEFVSWKNSVAQPGEMRSTRARQSGKPSIDCGAARGDNSRLLLLSGPLKGAAAGGSALEEKTGAARGECGIVRRLDKGFDSGFVHFGDAPATS